MALDLTVTYSGQVDDADPDYPQGAAQNVTVEGDGTGTPWEEQLVNDWLGFHQALLLQADIEPSGDPDNANVSQYAEAVGWIAASQHGTFDPVHPIFGAVGEIITELEDDTAELQACFDAAYASINGANVIVDLGGRSYRVTGALTCYPHVTVRNGKLVMYHASANFLVWATAATQRTATIWENVDLDYAQANTGKTIVNAAGVVDVVFRNCYLNANGLCTGKLFECEAESEFTFEKCTALSATTGTAMNSDFGKLSLIRGRYTMAPGATSNFLYGDTLYARGVDFVHVSSVGGIAFISTAGSDDFDCSVHDCSFDVDDSGAASSTYAIRLNANRLLRSSGNRLINDALLYDVSGVPLGAHSDIQLLPHIEREISGTTTTLPTGYRSVAVASTNAAPPDITIPDPLVEDQPLTVSVWNNHATDAWTGPVEFVCAAGVYYTQAGGLTDLGNLELVSVNFRAMIVGGDLVWVQIGDAAQHFLAS